MVKGTELAMAQKIDRANRFLRSTPDKERKLANIGVLVGATLKLLDRAGESPLPPVTLPWSTKEKIPLVIKKGDQQQTITAEVILQLSEYYNLGLLLTLPTDHEYFMDQIGHLTVYAHNSDWWLSPSTVTLFIYQYMSNGLGTGLGLMANELCQLAMAVYFPQRSQVKFAIEDDASPYQHEPRWCARNTRRNWTSNLAALDPSWQPTLGSRWWDVIFRRNPHFYKIFTQPLPKKPSTTT